MPHNLNLLEQAFLKKIQAALDDFFNSPYAIGYFPSALLYAAVNNSSVLEKEFSSPQFSTYWERITSTFQAFFSIQASQEQTLLDDGDYKDLTMQAIQSAIKRKAEYIVANLKQLYALKKNIISLHDLFLQLQNQHQTDSSLEIVLQKKIKKIKKLHALVSTMYENCLNYSDAKLSLNNTTSSALQNKFCDLVHHTFFDLMDQVNYTVGEATPGSAESMLRPTLYALANLDVIFVPDAGHFDRKAIEKIQQMTKNHSVLRQAQPIITIPKLDTIPDSYDKPITLTLLIDCLGYWFTKKKLSPLSEDKNKNPWPPLIEKMMEIVSALSIKLADVKDVNIDDLISNEIKNLIKDALHNLQLYATNDPLAHVKAALARTSTFSIKTQTNLKFMVLSKSLIGMQVDKYSPAQIEQMIMVKTRQLNNTDEMKEARENLKNDPRLKIIGEELLKIDNTIEKIKLEITKKKIK